MKTTTRKTTRILAAFALALGAAPAFAGNPLLVDTATGTPYTWQVPPGGPPAAFYNVDAGPLGSAIDQATAKAAVVAAFDAWEAVPDAAITYTDGGDLPVDVDAANYLTELHGCDGKSPIVFDPDGSVLALLGYDPNTVLAVAGIDCRTSGAPFAILEGFAVVGGNQIGPAGFTLDGLAGILVHELGHFSNLDHSVVNGDAWLFGDATGPSPFDLFGRPPASAIETMYAYADPGLAAYLRTPHADDAGMLAALYPVGPPAAGSSLAGRVLDADTTTGLTGINVVARNPNDPFDDAVSAVSGALTQGGGPLGLDDGRFILHGLTPGAGYAVYTDEIRGGKLAVPLRSSYPDVRSLVPGPFPGPEELYNGAAESAVQATDDPTDFVLVVAAASTPAIDIVFNVRADYPPAAEPGSHRFEAGTRGAPAFPDGTLVEIGPGEVHRLRFRPPALLDKASRLLLSFKAGAPGSWSLIVESITRDGRRISFSPLRSHGTWSFEHDFGLTAGGTAPGEVREINLLIRDTRSSGGPRPYALEADVVPQLRSAYAPDPASGTTRTVRHLLPSATVHPGTVLKLEVTFSAPVTTVEADFSAVDPAFNPAAVKVSGPVIGPSGAVYTLSYPLSYSATAGGGAVTVRAEATLGRQSFSTVDSSLHLSVGGNWTYLWDAGQLPTQAGWVQSDIGRPQPVEDVATPGLYHVVLDGVNARLYYAFRAPYLQQVPLTVEMRLRNAAIPSGTGTASSGWAGGSARYSLGFVLDYLGGGPDKIGLDYVQEPFPGDQYNNIFMDSKDGFHVYRVTVDGARTVRLYVDGALRLQAQAGTSSALQEVGFGFFYFYEGFWDYFAIKAGAALDPSALPSPPTAP